MWKKILSGVFSTAVFVGVLFDLFGAALVKIGSIVVDL